MAKLLLNANGKVLMKDDKVYKALEHVSFLQWKCDNMKTLSNEFHNYRGESVKEWLEGLDTSQVTNMDSFCNNCLNIKEIPPLDTSNVSSAKYFVMYCGKLTTLSFNMIKITTDNNATSMLNHLSNIVDLTLSNIKVKLSIGSGDSWGHLLTLESLINTIKELVNVGSSKTLTIGSANLEKIANVYVRRTTEGDIPTCLSDNSNIDLAKAPCEICESTDEGAMSIISYANMKNWTLA